MAPHAKTIDSDGISFNPVHSLVSHILCVTGDSTLSTAFHLSLLPSPLLLWVGDLRCVFTWFGSLARFALFFLSCFCCFQNYHHRQKAILSPPSLICAWLPQLRDGLRQLFRNWPLPSFQALSPSCLHPGLLEPMFYFQTWCLVLLLPHGVPAPPRLFVPLPIWPALHFP